MNRIVLFIVILLASCTSSVDKKFVRVDVDSLYRQSGVVRYFLPEMPTWANNSFIGKCYFTKQVRYLDLKSTSESFGLDFEQVISLQFTFDNNYYDAISKKQGLGLTLKEEESVFFESLDQVTAKMRKFKAPNSDIVNIVWIDNYMEKPTKLMEVMTSSKLHDGRIVLLSMCLTRVELEKFVSINKIDVDGIDFISNELFSIYNKEFKQEYIPILELDELFSKSQKLRFVTNDRIPINIRTKAILKKIK